MVKDKDNKQKLSSFHPVKYKHASFLFIITKNKIKFIVFGKKLTCSYFIYNKK